MIIRPRAALVDDYDAVVQLMTEADDLHAELMPTYFRRGAKPFRSRVDFARLLGAANEAIFVALAHAEPAPPVGMAHVQIYDTPPAQALVPRRRAHLDNILVATAHRRCGHGRALIEAVSDWARTKNAEEMLLTVWAGNESADRFYARLGFGRVSSVLGKAL